MLVSHGAVPLFINSLQSEDQEIQYYCAAALSNLAVDATHRAAVVHAGNHQVLRLLIRLLESPSEKVNEIYRFYQKPVFFLGIVFL